MATQRNNLSVARIDLNALDLQRRETILHVGNNWYLFGSPTKFLPSWDPRACVLGSTSGRCSLHLRRSTVRPANFLKQLLSDKKEKNVTIKNTTEGIFNKLYAIIFTFRHWEHQYNCSQYSWTIISSLLNWYKYVATLLKTMLIVDDLAHL